MGRTAAQDISQAELELAKQLQDVEVAAMETAESAMAQMRVQTRSHEIAMTSQDAEVKAKTDHIKRSSRSELEALERSTRARISLWRERAIAEAERNGAFERKKAAVEGMGEFGRISALLQVEFARVRQGPYSESLRKALANLDAQYSGTPIADSSNPWAQSGLTQQGPALADGLSQGRSRRVHLAV